jgi:hypothetical protein
MVAKKTTPRAAVNPTFTFKKEWIFDPVPPWLRLDRAAQTKINQLKDQFVKQINEQLKTGQR